MTEAIAHEKQLKGWRCEKNTPLIDAMNPQRWDISEDEHHAD